MVSIALAEAKARLSELIALVEAGEEVSITRRGRPIARIVAERPDKAPVDLDALRRFAAGVPRQEQGAGEFFASERAADRL